MILNPLALSWHSFPDTLGGGGGGQAGRSLPKVGVTLLLPGPHLVHIDGLVGVAVTGDFIPSSRSPVTQTIQCV